MAAVWNWWSTEAASIGALLAVGGVFAKFFIMNPLKAYIRDVTRPIQPNANGGKSLADVATKLTAIEVTINGIDQRLIVVDKRLDRHIEQHVGGDA